jgi:hypothetical protein
MVNVAAAEPLVYLCISTMLGPRLSNIPIPAKSALASPIRQAQSASAALACFRADSGTLDDWDSEPEAG